MSFLEKIREIKKEIGGLKQLKENERKIDKRDMAIEVLEREIISKVKDLNRTMSGRYQEAFKYLQEMKTSQDAINNRWEYLERLQEIKSELEKM